MRGTDLFRNREKRAEKPTLRSVILSSFYFIALGIVAFILAGLLMDHFDLYRLFGLNTIVLPLLKVSLGQVPRRALQITLGILILFLLQPLVVILIDLLGVGRKRDGFDRRYWGSRKR